MIGSRDQGPASDCTECRGTGRIGIPGGKCPMCASAHIARDFQELLAKEERMNKLDPSKRRYFGGVPFDFEFHWDTQLATRSTETMEVPSLSADYISALAAQAYNEHLHLRPAIIDALSPFQMMSKGWAASALAETIQNIIQFQDFYDPNEPPKFHFRYHGSWFGQAAELDRMWIGQYIASQTLLDLDVNVNTAAREILYRFEEGDPTGSTGSEFPTTILTADALTTPFQHQENNIVVWQGVEHFKAEDVKKFVAQAPIGTLFLMQGTDMEAPDHVQKIQDPYDLIDAQAEYEWRHISYFMGSMSSPYGIRYMVVFRKEK